MANVKTNDTTIFPITLPAVDDILFGTDVSDTSNSPDGESVNFTVGSIFSTAPNGTLPKEALSGLCIGAVGNPNTSEISIIDLDEAQEITLIGYFSASRSTAGSVVFSISFSANNGVSYGTDITLDSKIFGPGGGSISSQFALSVDIVTGQLRLSMTNGTISNAIVTVPAGCNAVRLSKTTEGGGSMSATVYVTGGRA